MSNIRKTANGDITTDWVLCLFSCLYLALGECHLRVMFVHVQVDARESAEVVGVRCHGVGN